MRLNLLAATCVTAYACLAELQTGSLPPSWISPAGNCMEDPEWKIHQYNEDLYILRQSGCTHYEKPFLYLIFGKDKALLLDTGAGTPHVAAPVMNLVQKRAKGKPMELVVTHSHEHRDHTAGDAELAAISGVKVIPAKVDDLKTAFGISEWPTHVGSIDLGSRVVDVIPIPGHADASITLYDRRTGLLLTGDTVYAGRLYVGNWEQFAASIRRLVDFTKTRPVTHVLGTHIEQTSTPFKDYVTGTTYQPAEHTLEMNRGVLLELDEAITAAKGTPTKISLRDVTVVPRSMMQQNAWIPRDFLAPTLYETAKYKLVPLGPTLAQHDYEAYMSSIDHLRKNYTNGGSWPNKDITMADALKDVEGEISRFHARTSFTYAVLNAEGTKELGCIYVRPSRKAGYDAQVTMWVTAERYQAGFDQELFAETKQWIAANWPFKKVAYPKREISQPDWDALPNQ